MYKVAIESIVKKIITHMTTIGQINVEPRNWLEQILLKKWAFSHDSGQRYEIMTTNMFEVFNHTLKSARNQG